MKNSILTICLIGFSCVVFGQAAGNWAANQKKIGSSSIFSSGFESNNVDYGYNESLGLQQSSYYLPTYSYVNDTTIEIKATLVMNVKPDTYQAIFGVSQVTDSIERGHKMINQRIDRFIKAIESLGISKKDIYVDFISQVPIFEYEVEKKLFSKTYNEIPKGFELKKNLHVNYSDHLIADKLLTSAAKNEIYDIIKVEQIVTDIESNYDTLRAEAVTILNKKSDDFKKLGLNISPMYQTVQETIYAYYPMERYSSYGTFNYASLNAVNKSDKYLSGGNESSSLYYSKLSYSGYDKVINPIITQPVVQFTYSLKMRYVLKKQ